MTVNTIRRKKRSEEKLCREGWSKFTIGTWVICAYDTDERVKSDGQMINKCAEIDAKVPVPENSDENEDLMQLKSLVEKLLDDF